MEYKVILMAGQSNCNGEAPFASFSATQKLEKTKTLIWYKGALSYFKLGVNNRRRSIVEQKGGWSTELATQIEANYNGRVIFLKVAEGSTGTYTGQPWNTSTTTWFASQYNQLLIDIVNFQLFFAKNFPNDTYVYKCLCWNQGEQDGTSSGNSLLYETNCDTTFTGIKTALGLPNLPIYDWYLSDLSATTFKANINTAKAALRTAHANGGTIFSTNAADGYAFQDLYHPDYASYTLAGQRLYTALIANGHL